MLLSGMQPPQLSNSSIAMKYETISSRVTSSDSISVNSTGPFFSRAVRLNTLLDGEAVARDGAEHAPRLLALRLPRQNTLQRAHQPIQRKPRQLDRLRRQRVFLRQLGKYLHRRLLKFLHASGALFIELVFLQPADERLFRRFLAVLRQFRAGAAAARGI